MILFELVCVLVAFGFWAPGLPLLPRRIIRSASAYALVVFVARPAYLLINNPLPSGSDPIADPLMLVPTYAAGVEDLSGLIALGQATFLVFAYGAFGWRRIRWANLNCPKPGDLSPIWALYVISWVCRVAAVGNLATASGPGVIILRLTSLGTALTLFLIVARDWRSSPSARQAVVIMSIGEVLWSILDTSKTPLIGTAFAFYIDPERSGQSVRWAIGAILSVFVSFDVIERLKPDQSSVSHHGIGGLVDVLIQRFDMLHAVSVARADGPGSYMSSRAAIGQMLAGLVPQQLLGVHRLADGQNWAAVMEQATSSVSVSTGPVAEGYAVGGFGGIVFSELFTVIILVFAVSSLFRAKAFWLPLLSAYVLGSAATFEQGPLGLTETVGNSLQVGVACAIVLLVLPRGRRLAMTSAA